MADSRSHQGNKRSASCVVNTHSPLDDGVTWSGSALIQTPAAPLSLHFHFNLLFVAHSGGQKRCLPMSSDRKNLARPGAEAMNEAFVPPGEVVPLLLKKKNPSSFVPLLALEWLCCSCKRFTSPAWSWKSEPTCSSSFNGGIAILTSTPTTPSLPPCLHTSSSSIIKFKGSGFELALIDRRNSLCCLHLQHSGVCLWETSTSTSTITVDLWKHRPVWADISDLALILLFFTQNQRCVPVEAETLQKPSEIQYVGGNRRLNWKFKWGSNYITELLYNYLQNCSLVLS